MPPTRVAVSLAGGCLCGRVRYSLRAAPGLAEVLRPEEVRA